MDKIIFGDDTRIFVVSDKKNFQNSINGKSFENDFYKYREKQRIAIVNTCSNHYMSLFHHIRNALAHGRIAMYDVCNGKDIMFVMEDGKKSDKGAKCKFEVTARIVILKSTLLKIIDYIKKPPKTINYEDLIYKAIVSGSTTKKDIIELLNINEKIWNYNIGLLKKSNKVYNIHHKWYIKKEEF